MSGKLRIAMIGGGPGSMIGPVHRAAMRMTDEFELVAGAFSSSQEKSLQLAQSLGIPRENVYISYEDLVKDAESLRLDAVSIVTPNFLHINVAQAFVEKGVHVICEKPLSSSWSGVEKLNATIDSRNVVFALTHTYSAYPAIRKARELVAEGKLGKIKSVAVEYIQGWLAELLEQDPANRGAVWREDPQKGGPGGVLGDIGTHAFQLAEFVSGLGVTEVLSNVSSTAGREVPDDAKLLLKFTDEAAGSLWCSQVAIGYRNEITLRILGDRGSLSWTHDRNEDLHIFLDGTETIYHKGQDGDGTLPPGHPEGYYEAFAELYKEFGHQIKSRNESQKTLPGLQTGIRGLKFIDATLESAEKGGVWTQLN